MMDARTSRGFFGPGLTLREVHAHALIVLVLLWGLGLMNFLRPGTMLWSGQVKGADFVHFYSIGAVVVSDIPKPVLYDMNGLHQVQASVVPGSDDVWYFPINGPQTALFFAPFALLPYIPAVALWALVTIGIYAGLMMLAWSRTTQLEPHRRLVFIAAAGFAPFWQLVLHGQTTPILLVGFVLAWLALEHRNQFAAGLAIGLIAAKPQVGLIIAAVVLLSGAWRIVAGVFVSIALQAGAVLLILGVDTLKAYIAAVSKMPHLVEVLEPKPYQMHSIRGFLNLFLPDSIATPIWLVACVVIVVVAYKVWRSSLPLTVRFAAVLIGTVLASPHLTIYDATLLAPALLWYVDFVLRRGRDVRPHLMLVYWLCVCFVLPTATVIPIQVSVIVMAYLGWRIFRLVDAPQPIVANEPARS